MSSVQPIPADTFKLGFIGAGKMAESIARGVVKSGVLPASRIQTAHKGARRAAFESFGVGVFEHNNQVYLLIAFSICNCFMLCFCWFLVRCVDMELKD